MLNISHSYIIVRGEHDPIDELQKPEDDKPYESLLNTEDMGGDGAQKDVCGERIMDLLKELETARKEREVDPIAGVHQGDGKDIGNVENAKSVIGA